RSSACRWWPCPCPSSRCPSACRSSLRPGVRTSRSASPMPWNRPKWSGRRDRPDRAGRIEIDRPEVGAEGTYACERDELGLVTNDVATLNATFRKDDRTIRYGIAENLYGHKEVAAFRAARSPINLMRTYARSVITTYGRDFAVASTLFYRQPLQGKV